MDDKILKKEALLSEIEELKGIRDVLKQMGNDIERFKVLEDLEDKVKSISLDSKKEDMAADHLRKALKELDVELSDIGESLKEYTKQYEETYKRMNEIIKNTEEKLNSSSLTEEEIEKIKNDSLIEKEKLNKQSVEIKKAIESLKKTLSNLKGRRKRIESELDKAEVLGLSIKEYRDIYNSKKKREIFREILKEKGLDVLLNKPKNERTVEEIDRLANSKKEIIDEIISKIRNNEISLASSIGIIESLDNASIVNKKVLKVRKKDYPKLLTGVSIFSNEQLLLPSGTMETVKMLNPGSGDEKKPNLPNVDNLPKNKDTKNENIEKKNDTVEKDALNSERNPQERITVYRDLSSKDYYVNQAVVLRFKLDKSLGSVRIDNRLYYKVKEKDALQIIHYGDDIKNPSPYLVDLREIDFTDKKNNVNVINSKDIQEVLFYRDLDDNNQLYISKSVLSQFDIATTAKSVLINGEECYKLSESIENFIKYKFSHDSSLKEVYKDIHLSKEEQESLNNKVVYTEGKILSKKDITVDKSDKAKDTSSSASYSGAIVTDEDRPLEGDVEEPAVEEEPVVEEGPVDDESTDDEVVESEETTSLDDEDSGSETSSDSEDRTDEDSAEAARPHVEAILYKLTKDLNIHAKDAKRYHASNIKVSKEFRNELKSGNYLYNIVHFVPAVGKATVNFLRKLSNRLLMTKNCRETIEELKRRLDEDLTEEELEELYDKYRGSQLKTDMNNQINSLILERLRRYGLEKVREVNDSIREDYNNLFSHLIDIKILNNEIDSTESEEDIHRLNEEINAAYQEASRCVSSILDKRNKANHMLSSGVHGLEEDFKAVQTKMSYVGKRFAKDKSFDNDLQEVLAKYGQDLNDAMASGDCRGIVDNFMKLETCYFSNTKIKNSLLGKRSVDDKYYTPIPEPFDYRDDPFIRDLFTTVALTTAAVSAANAFRVHQVQNKELLQNQRDEAFRVNNNNDNTVGYAHEVGDRITGSRDVIAGGMRLQTERDVLSVANMVENGSEVINKFQRNVQYQINGIISDYATGAINSVEVLAGLRKVVENSQATFVGVAKDCLNVVREYGVAHPEIDIAALEDSLSYVVAHPNAITDMNNAIYDITNMAEGLSTLSATHVTPLTSLPSDFIPSLIGAASSCVYALRVSREMDKKYNKQNGYGNEITEMMEHYVNGDIEGYRTDEEEDVSHMSR